MRAVVAGGAVAGCSMLLVGCSSASSGAPPSTRTSDIAPGETVPFDLAHNARSDVKQTSCARQSGQWAVHGTVTNPAPTSKSFQIVVDFVTRPGSTVLSSAIVNVSKVKSHATAHWSATGARGKSGVACVVRQAQTT